MSRGFPEKINSMTKEEIEDSVERVKNSKSKYNKKYYKEHKELRHQYYLNHIDKWRKNNERN